MGSENATEFRLGADNKREVLESASRARELFAPLLHRPADAPPVARIVLTNKALYPPAADVAADAIAAVATSLTDIDLADVIASIPETEALTTLERLAVAIAAVPGPVTSLNFSDNALGLKGVRAIQPALSAHRPTLRHLFFSNNGLDVDAATHITSLLTTHAPDDPSPPPPPFSPLTTLHFHSNMMGPAGVCALAPLLRASPSLVDLRLTSLRADSASMRVVADALRADPPARALVRVNLSDASVADGDAREAWAAVLEAQRGLEVMLLRDALLGDEGCRSVGVALGKAAANVEVLDLSGNEISARGVAALAAWVKGRGALRQLVLEENEMKSAGAKRLAAVLDPDVHTALEALVVGSNEIGDAGALALADAVSKLPAFKKLDLASNEISEAVQERITEILPDAEVLLDENEGEEGADEDDDNEEDEAELDAEAAEVAELLAKTAEETRITETPRQEPRRSSWLSWSYAKTPGSDPGQSSSQSPGQLLPEDIAEIRKSTEKIRRAISDLKSSSSSFEDGSSSSASAPRVRRVVDVSESETATTSRTTAPKPTGGSGSRRARVRGRRLEAEVMVSESESLRKLAGRFLALSFVVTLLVTLVRVSERNLDLFAYY